MFFHLLLRANAQVKDYCHAPVLNIEPLSSDYKLKYSYLIFRHGARAPDTLFLPRDHRGSQWRCNENDGQVPQMEFVPMNNPRRIRKVKDTEWVEYPPNCAKGELTTEGQNQEYELGKSYRSYFVDKLHYLPDEFDPSVVEIRASHKDRTYRSTIAFVHGLYPVLYPNEYFELHQGSDVIDPFDPATTTCRDLNDLFVNWTAQPDFIALRDKVIANISDILAWTNVPEKAAENAVNLDVLCDFVTTLDCNDVPFPSTVSQQAITTCTEWTPYMMYAFYEQNPAIASSRYVRYMRQSVDKALNGQTPYKMTLVGCHDSTLLSYAVLLGQKPDKNTPYASHILTEVYEKDSSLYVRVLLNNEVMKINGKELISYTEWKNILAKTDGYCLETYTVESFVSA